MHRFLRLVSRPENASIVRAELREMDGKYGRTLRAGNWMPAVPCPYSVSLVAIAWTSNLDAEIEFPDYNGVTLRHGLLNANMGCWGGDNNDGISIIDVSDPTYPAYCFMKRDVPMSAYEYLNSYYHLKGTISEKEDIQRYWQGIHNLCGIRLLTAEILQEAWPHESFRARTPTQDDVLAPRDFALFSLATGAASLGTTISRMLENPNGAEPKKWFAALIQRQDVLNSESRTLLEMKSLLLKHPHAFNFRYIQVPAPPAPSDDLEHLLRLLSKPSTSGDHEALAARTAARAHVKTALRVLSPFPDEYLDGLVKMTIVGGDRFVDLSGYHLSAAQITRFVSQCPNLDALDISQNPYLTLHDIPDILLAAPNLLRVNVSGCSQIDGPALLDLVRTQPSLFRTIEALIHPVFLTILKPPDYPIAFTFMFANTDGISGAALPFFTPAQVLQALCRLLPLAWGSEVEQTPKGLVPTSIGIPGDEGGGDATWFMGALLRLRHVMSGSMAMSSPMLAYAAFSGGSQRPGDSWSDRSVVGVPLHPYPSVSAGPDGSWAFFLDWSSPWGGRQQWAFIRYGPDDEEDVSSPSTEERTERTSPAQSEQASATPDDDDVAGPSLAPGASGEPSRSSVAPEGEVRTRRGKVYDLRGFLRCMAEEGRPSPPEELAAALENTLYMRHQHDGSLFCPLMGDEDAPMGVPVIPQVPVRDVPGDVMTRINFTLATGIPSRFRGGY